MSSFPERLKELRTAASLTQIELAQKLGLSNGAIGNYESGARTPRKLDDLEALADFFNVDMDYLLGRANRKPEYNLEEQWIISCYRNADKDTKDGIKSLLRKYDPKDTTVSSAS